MIIAHWSHSRSSKLNQSWIFFSSVRKEPLSTTTTNHISIRSVMMVTICQCKAKFLSVEKKFNRFVLCSKNFVRLFFGIFLYAIFHFTHTQRHKTYCKTFTLGETKQNANVMDVIFDRDHLNFCKRHLEI